MFNVNNQAHYVKVVNHTLTILCTVQQASKAKSSLSSCIFVYFKNMADKTQPFTRYL